ncbi:MAG: hypothetical protein WCP36_09115 [Methanomicrobiales archaeon]
MSMVLYFDDEPDHQESSGLFMEYSGNLPFRTITRVIINAIPQFRPGEEKLSGIYSPSEDRFGTVNPGGERDIPGRINRNGA